MSVEAAEDSGKAVDHVGDLLFLLFSCTYRPGYEGGVDMQGRLQREWSGRLITALL
jgi:hypothetical protein